MVPGAIGLRQIVVFLSSGTFTKATYPWLARVHAVVVAGGGGGGGVEASTSNQVAAGAGGGGGGGAEVVVDESALGANETVTVGAGGAGNSGAAGSNGANSIFGAHAVATGGDGGDVGAATGTFLANTIGDGGAGTTGDVLYQGGDGEPGIACGPASVNIAIGGGGGCSYMAGRATDLIYASGGAMEANSGRGGFGASVHFSTTAAAAGATGGKGIVILFLYA